MWSMRSRHWVSICEGDPLIVAAENHHLEVVKALLDHGFDEKVLGVGGVGGGATWLGWMFFFFFHSPKKSDQRVHSCKTK